MTAAAATAAADAAAAAAAAAAAQKIYLARAGPAASSVFLNRILRCSFSEISNVSEYLEAFLEATWSVLEGVPSHSEALGSVLFVCLHFWEATWKPLGASCRPLGASCRPLGAS